MYVYYLTVWDTETPRDKVKVKEIKRFYSAIDAWKYVLENNIEKYSVDAGECVLDHS